jgi:DNA-binding XRE family transcriptional regulator
MQETTGMDLRLERVRSRIKANRLAATIGVSRQRIWQIEELPSVTDRWRDRYLAALRTLTGQS